MLVILEMVLAPSLASIWFEGSEACRAVCSVRPGTFDALGHELFAHFSAVSSTSGWITPLWATWCRAPSSSAYFAIVATIILIALVSVEIGVVFTAEVLRAGIGLLGLTSSGLAPASGLFT